MIYPVWTIRGKLPGFKPAKSYREIQAMRRVNKQITVDIARIKQKTYSLYRWVTAYRRDYHPSWNTMRKRIIKANPFCVSCKSTEYLHVHHLDGSPYNNKPNNLCVICAPCHYKEHGMFGY